MFGLKNKTGQQEAQWLEITRGVDELWNALVVPWRDKMLQLFTDRVGTNMVLNDDHPEAELDPAIDEFIHTAEEQLKVILPNVADHLTEIEKRSFSIGRHRDFDILMDAHVDTLATYMGQQSTLIGRRLLAARREELGLPVDQTIDLVEGRKLMKAVRARPLEMTPELKRTLIKAYDLLERTPNSEG